MTINLHFDVYAPINELVDQLRDAEQLSDTLRQAHWQALATYLTDLVAQALQSNIAWTIAAECIQQIFAVLSTNALTHLDIYLRHRLRLAIPDTLFRSTLPNLTLQDAGAISAVVCCHSSGFVREKAVRQLERRLSEFSLPMALIRSCDHVPAVTVIALRVLDQVIAHGQTQWWGRWLALFSLLENKQNAWTIRHKIEHWLRSNQDIAQQLLQLFVASRNSNAKAILMAMCSPQSVSPSLAADILQSALNDSSGKIRSKAIKNVLSRRDIPVPVVLSVLPTLLNDRDSHIRRLALSSYAKLSTSSEHIYNALLDPDSFVRLDALSYLKQREEECDLRTVAKEVLLSPERHKAFRICGALAALASLQSREDWPFIASFLGSKAPSIRSAAVIALSNLAPDLFVDVFLAEVKRPERKQALAGAMAIGHACRIIPKSTLLKLCSDETVHTDARKHLLRLTEYL